MAIWVVWFAWFAWVMGPFPSGDSRKVRRLVAELEAAQQEIARRKEGRQRLVEKVEELTRERDQALQELARCRQVGREEIERLSDIWSKVVRGETA